MYYVYILRSEIKDVIYTGYTSDLVKRLKAHNSRQSPHTKRYRPWHIVMYTAFTTKQRARLYETYLKTGSGIAFARRHLL
jgi:predicted GIY-YIG superfamily endonuclease